MVKADLEKKIQSLETELEEMQNGFRNLARENQSLVNMISGLSDSLALLREDVAKLKTNRTESLTKRF